jgi:hypothetical protein
MHTGAVEVSSGSLVFGTVENIGIWFLVLGLFCISLNNYLCSIMMVALRR